VTIHVIQYGRPFCKLVEGDYANIQKAVTVFDPTAKHKRMRVPSYIAARIPDHVSFYDYAERSFPSGLLEDVEQLLRANRVVYKVLGKPQTGTIPTKGLHADMLFGKSMSGKYAFQLEAAKAAVEAERGVLWLATNCIHGAAKVVVTVRYPDGRHAKPAHQKVIELKQLVRKFNNRSAVCDKRLPYYLVPEGPDNGWRNHYFERPWHRDWSISVLQQGPDGKIREGRVKRAWATGPKEVFRLTVEDGHTTVCTADHRFMTPDGWKTLGELRPGDHVLRRFLQVRTEPYRILSIEPAGVTDCFDIEMEDAGSPNFIADGFVVHNSGKTTILAAMVKHLSEKLGGRGCIIVPDSGLLHQTAREIREMVGRSPTVGRIGNGLRELGDIVVATAQTLRNGIKGARYYDPKLAQLLASLTFMLVDENHHASADTWKAILSTTRARVVIGVTGTHHSGNAVRDFTVKAFVGPVIKRVTNEDLAQKGVSARVYVFAVIDPGVYAVDYTAEKFEHDKKGRLILNSDERPIWRDPRLRVQEEMAFLEDAHFVASICESARAFNTGKLKPCILSSSLAQLDLIEAGCRKRGLHPYVVKGSTPGDQRVKIVKKFSADPLGVLVASKVFDEGFNAPSIGALLLAGLGKSNRQVCQRIGRALRAKKDGINAVAVMDFIANNGDYLSKHSIERVGIYKREKFRVVGVRDLRSFWKRCETGDWSKLIGEKRYAEELKRAGKDSPTR